MITLHDLCAHLLPPNERLTFKTLIIAEPHLILVAALMSPTSTCPDCCQPTDRIHSSYPRTLADLPWATTPMKNVAAALQEVFSVHHRELDQLHRVPPNESPTQNDDAVTVPTACPAAMTKAQQHIAHNRTKRVTEYAQAHALPQHGWTMKAISTYMGRHHRAVKKYLQASAIPGRHLIH